MKGPVARLSDIFAAEPDNAAKAAALLLALYLVTLLPMLFWSLQLFLSSTRRQKTAPLVARDQNLVSLPTPEQTALLIRKRRSIFTKDLSGEPVDRSVVEAMLEAANWAPTHGKTEPWRFVVMGKDGLQEFISVMVEAVHSIASNSAEQKIAKLNSKRRKLSSVSWAIAICFKRQAGEKLMPEWEELAATAAAVQNMHLTATALGASGYWTSWGPEEARDSRHVKSWLGLAEEDRCIGVFLLGKSDRGGGYKASRGPVSEETSWRT